MLSGYGFRAFAPIDGGPRALRDPRAGGPDEDETDAE